MVRKFILVGAGPGDAELISIKGLNTLKTASVILYDALVDESLLNHAPQATSIYVGKRAGEHYMSQQEINELIVANLKQHSIVVRLKGGDPFIFGRGQEEIDYVNAQLDNVTIEVIPGISAAIGIPSLHQLPLTQRGTNESVWIVTGTTAKCELSKDITLAAQSTATVVILMGMNQLQNIVNIFLHYRHKEQQVVIIQNGSMPNEKKVIGNLATIEDLAKLNKLKSPAIIVIGNT